MVVGQDKKTLGALLVPNLEELHDRKLITEEDFQEITLAHETQDSVRYAADLEAHFLPGPLPFHQPTDCTWKPPTHRPAPWTGLQSPPCDNRWSPKAQILRQITMSLCHAR